MTILYVSHRLDEIFELTDRIVVLRDGSLVAAIARREIDAGRLVHDMVGRPLEQVYPRTRGGTLGPPLLELEGVSRAGMFHNVSLTVRAGEIVGLAGLVGAGRSELARAVYGLYPVDGGTMRLARRLAAARTRAIARAGLVYVPEERKRQGFVLEHSLAEAIGIGFSDRLTRFGLIRRGRSERRVREAIERYDIRATGPRQADRHAQRRQPAKGPLGPLARTRARVIILDEPTRGVDVGAKSQIHALVDSWPPEAKASCSSRAIWAKSSA